MPNRMNALNHRTETTSSNLIEQKNKMNEGIGSVSSRVDQLRLVQCVMEYHLLDGLNLAVSLGCSSEEIGLCLKDPAVILKHRESSEYFFGTLSADQKQQLEGLVNEVREGTRMFSDLEERGDEIHLAREKRRQSISTEYARNLLAEIDTVYAKYLSTKEISFEKKGRGEVEQKKFIQEMLGDYLTDIEDALEKKLETYDFQLMLYRALYEKYEDDIRKNVEKKYHNDPDIQEKYQHDFSKYWNSFRPRARMDRFVLPEILENILPEFGVSKEEIQALLFLPLISQEQGRAMMEKCGVWNEETEKAMKNSEHKVSHSVYLGRKQLLEQEYKSLIAKNLPEGMILKKKGEEYVIEGEASEEEGTIEEMKTEEELLFTFPEGYYYMDMADIGGRLYVRTYEEGERANVFTERGEKIFGEKGFYEISRMADIGGHLYVVAQEEKGGPFFLFDEEGEKVSEAFDEILLNKDGDCIGRRGNEFLGISLEKKTQKKYTGDANSYLTTLKLIEAPTKEGIDTYKNSENIPQKTATETIQETYESIITKSRNSAKKITSLLSTSPELFLEQNTVVSEKKMEETAKGKKEDTQ